VPLFREYVEAELLKLKTAWGDQFENLDEFLNEELRS